MDTVIKLMAPEVLENGAVNLHFVRIFYFAGEEVARKDYYSSIEKGFDLSAPLNADFGQISLADFPAEKQYIEAKWAE